MQRVLELAFLEVDARETIRGVVAHDLVDCAFEHGRDRAPGAVVHSVVELEVADGELRLAQIVVQRVERRLVDGAMLAELGVEPLERFEEMALLRVVQRFAEIPVAARSLLSSAGGRAAATAARPQASRPNSVLARMEGLVRRSRLRAGAAYHSPSSIAAGPLSAMPSSFGSTPLSNANVSVLLKSSPLVVLPLIETSISCAPVGTLPV